MCVPWVNLALVRKTDWRGHRNWGARDQQAQPPECVGGEDLMGKKQQRGQRAGGDSEGTSFVNEQTSDTLLSVCYGLANGNKW